MEKLSLFNAVNNKTLDSSFVSMDDAEKYTTFGNIYKSRYEEIGRNRKAFRRIVLMIVLLCIAIGCYLIFSTIALDENNYAGASLIVLGMLGVAMLGDLADKHIEKDGIEHMVLSKEIVAEIRQFYFKELFELANNDEYIFNSALENAEKLGVSEDKIEKYIKGYIKQKNEEKILEERRKEKEINDVILYSEMHEIV